jgi:DTW domain-containing protein YfiP
VQIAFLQHPEERRLMINTAWLAHLSLSNSKFFRGINLDLESDYSTWSQNLDPKTTALLFPGEGAIDLNQPLPEIKTLLVPDGTWSKAGKVVRLTPSLQKYPKLVLPYRGTPSHYRIRKAPRPEYLSTVESVVQALRTMEDNPKAYQNLIELFNKMVETQLSFGDHKFP